MNYLMEKVFEHRGYEEGFFEKINVCDHGVPKGTDELCRYLQLYHESGDLLVALTDFDTDGVMSGVIALAGLSELGINVSLYRPTVTDGYGFTAKTIDALVAEYPEVKGIITADVGITCYDGVRHARDLGLDVFVTDHHQPQLPIDATVWVDPVREDEDSGYAGTCGSAVLYYVLLHYAEHYAKDAFLTEQIRRLCVFAGCGTVADRMPVFFENRRLINDAIAIFEFVFSGGDRNVVDSLPGKTLYRRAFLGLYILLDTFKQNGHQGLNTDPMIIHEDFIGFYIAPVINSIKRMGSDLNLIYSVFFGPDPLMCMQQLYDLNEQRKQLVNAKFADLLDPMFPQPWAPYIYITDGDSGIRGLLAQKMMQLTGMPVIVIGSDNGTYTGSGRCPAWFPFLDMSVPADPWHAAGHNPAFGIGIPDDAGLDALFAFFERNIPLMMPEPSESSELVADFSVSMFNDGDTDLNLGHLISYLDELDNVRPFGDGFEEPQALLRINTQLAEFSIMGKKKNHLKIRIPKGISVICWNQADIIRDHGTEIHPGKDDPDHRFPYWVSDDLPVDLNILGKFEYNYYNDIKSIQFVGMIVEDF